MSSHERTKTGSFLLSLDCKEDTFVYMVNSTTFVAVFDGECAMAYFKAQLETVFEDEPIIVELR